MINKINQMLLCLVNCLTNLVLFSSIAPAMALAETNLVVSYTGEIFWVPPTVVEFPCITDHAGEAYKCAAKMGSWAYDGFKVLVVKFESSRDAT